MRITYAKLVGYAGFYAGLGKTEIEIDFTKCKNRIIVISGANGSGKSTLLNALSILPDSNDILLPSMAAYKRIIIDDQGVIYNILINHGLDGKGNRIQTKAYISKNGLELNPNGNISSYKDIIFNEFNLDSNFISLTHVSGDNRGIADKKPSERKKFIASITSSLDVYNDINKKLTKKSNTYRSYINSISSKIQNIGDESGLRSTLVSLKSRSERLNTEIEDLKQQVIECRTVLALNDPNGQLKLKYDNLTNQLLEKEKERDQLFTFIRNIIEQPLLQDIKLNSLEEIDIALNNISKEIENDNEIYFKEKEELVTYNSNISSISIEIEQSNIKIEKLKQEINPQLESEYESISKEIFIIEDAFAYHKLGTQTELSELSESDLKQIINIGTDILSAIDLIYESIPNDYLNHFISIIKSGIPISIQVASLGEKINLNKDNLIVIKEKKSQLESDYQMMLELNKRPDKCKIDTCYFLSKYQDISCKYKDLNDIESKLQLVNQEMEAIIQTIQSNTKELDLLKDWICTEAIIDKVKTLSISNHNIFNKLGIYRLLGDFDFILTKISQGENFNDFKETMNDIRNMSNDIIQYKTLKKIQEKLDIERKLTMSSKNALKELEDKIIYLSDNLNSIKEQRDSIKKSVDFTSCIIGKKQEKEKYLKELRSKYVLYLDLEKEINQLSQELNKLNQQFSGSSELLQKIANLMTKVQSLQNELDPIDAQKEDINYKINMLDNYRCDYNQYFEQYTIIDKLKKYSSPTSTGIQTLFMSLYMGKTLETSNQLLGMLFQGQYQLLNYIINEEEFRIPFTSNGFTVDDISNGSTSQICMMGMIINLVLLHQASTKFNIYRLDEIDGGLDTANRSVFVDILQTIIRLLDIDQLFIISHSCESALANVDQIQLAPIEGFNDNATGANIIYDWRNN